MNLLFRVFILLGALVVVALFSALLAPYWIDWKQFTRDFEQQASRVIGQPVQVGGETNLRLLPLPFISFEDLEVGQNQDGSPLMTVERFSLYAELFPFLSGEVRIVEMSMLKPHLNLQVEENGTVAWTSRTETIVDPEQVKIEKLVIENGSAKINGLAGGRELSVSNIQSELSAQSVLGPWRFQANADIEGVPSALRISTGSYQQSERSIRVKVETSRNDRPYLLSLDGPLKLKDDILSWSGDFEISPFSPAGTNGPGQVVEPLPVTADGIFHATPHLVQVPEYRLEIGAKSDPYVVTGNGVAQIGETVFFKAQADGRQIDLDRIKQTEGEASGAPTLERRLAALRSVIERIPVPTASGEVDILLPAVVAGDTFIRDVKAVVRPFEQGWDLRSMVATFPGNTRLEARGRVGLHEDFGFAGRLLVASRQPSGFAAWLSGDVSPQIRRLKAVGLDASATISPRQVTFDNLELRLDDAFLQGKLQRIGGSDQRPAIIAELTGNRVNTEDLRALYSLARGQNDTDLVSHDLNITIGADRLETVFLGEPVNANSVDAQVQVRDGSVSVERFEAKDLFGAEVVSNGRIEDVLSQPNGNMQFSMRAEDGSHVLAFLDKIAGGIQTLQPLLNEPALARNLALKIELDTTSRDEGVKGVLLANGAIAETEIEFRTGFEGEFQNTPGLKTDTSIILSNPVPAVLMRQIGVETLPDLLADEVQGPLKLNLGFVGTGAKGFDSRLLATAPQTSVSATGNIAIDSWQVADYDLSTTLGSENLMPWLRLASIPLPVSRSANLPTSARFTVSKMGQNLTFDNLSGQVAGNEFSGRLALQREGVARPRLDGDLSLQLLDLELLGDLVFGRFNAFGLADNVLPDEDLNFGDPPYAGMDAKVSMKANRASIGEVLEGENVEAKLVLIDGAADINDIRLEALGGHLSGSLNLKNSGGTVLVSGNIFLSKADAAGLLGNLGLGKIADGDIQLTSSFEGAGRSVSGVIANLSGNGFAKLENSRVAGVNPDSLNLILEGADVEGFEVNSTSVQTLVDEAVLDGEFGIETIDAPFSINLGRLKMRNVVHEAENTRMSGSIEAELLTGNAEAGYSIAFTPSRREAISGAEPQVSVRYSGPLGAMERTIDTSQLEGYLSLRAFENSQRRVETLEAKVIEKQRLLRQIAYNFAEEQFVLRKTQEARDLAEQVESKRLQEAVRKLEDERKRSAEEAIQAQEAERQRKEAERKAAEEAALQAAEEAERLAAEQAEREAASQQQGDIQSEPLPKLKDEPAPGIRNSIIQNLENFLRGQ